MNRMASALIIAVVWHMALLVKTKGDGPSHKCIWEHAWGWWCAHINWISRIKIIPGKLSSSTGSAFLYILSLGHFTLEKSFAVQLLPKPNLQLFNLVCVQVLGHGLGSRCWTGRSHVEKKLLVVVCGLSLALFICILTLGLHYNESEWQKNIDKFKS